MIGDIFSDVRNSQYIDHILIWIYLDSLKVFLPSEAAVKKCFYVKVKSHFSIVVLM